MLNVGLNTNGVKKIDVNEMREGYLQMALINKQICEESLHMANEAEKTLESFLGN
jgi:hypothetical protein